MEIREATVENFPTVAAIMNAVWPEFPLDAEMLRRDQDTLEPHLRPSFLLAGDFGLAEVWRDIGSYDPRRWSILVTVLPASRRQGLGDSLYRAAVATLTDPISVDTRVHEDDQASLRFAEARGFVETKRDFVSALNLEGKDFPAPELPGGLTLVRLSEADSSDVRHRLHEVFEDVRRDVPRTSPATPLSFEFFQEQTIDDPHFLLDGLHLAVDGQEIVGFTGMFESTEPGVAEQWLTGVRRECRGKGVARALKVAGIRFAKERGFRTILTDNDSRNSAMLAVNESLGFVRRSGLVSLRKLMSAPNGG